jgi:hypothetical protein
VTQQDTKAAVTRINNTIPMTTASTLAIHFARSTEDVHANDGQSARRMALNA